MGSSSKGVVMPRLLSLVACCATAAASRGARGARTGGAIDREAVVKRHNVHLAAFDPAAPLTVGNGEFAFTADPTGADRLARVACGRRI